MSDLATFLLDRFAEDEATARSATQGNRRYPRWEAEPSYQLMKGCRCLSCWEPNGSWDVQPIDGPDCLDHGCFHAIRISQADAHHIARHDPARILAECEARRRLVERVSDVAQATYSVRDVVLELLALPYADHPDYRSEWTP